MTCKLRHDFTMVALLDFFFFCFVLLRLDLDRKRKIAGYLFYVMVDEGNLRALCCSIWLLPYEYLFKFSREKRVLEREHELTLLYK